MNNIISVKIDNLSKVFKLFENSRDRFKEALHPFKKQYHKKFYALSDINLTVKKGEIIGIIGRNGCGKSTLLKILAGIYPQTTGNVEINGTISALLELGSGFNPLFTGRENIYFFSIIQGYSKEFIKAKEAEIIEFADIGEFIDQPVKNYSSGMRSRLAFALAVNVDPDILIVDEALAAGDAKFKEKSHDRINDIINSGVTALIVTHSGEEIKRLCTRAVMLKQGRLILDGSPEEVVEAYGNLIGIKKEDI